MSDYVVRPKRRRNGTLKAQAVDPCLGYYIPLPADAPTRTADLDVTHASRMEINTAVDVGRRITANELDPGVQEYHGAGDEIFNIELLEEGVRSDLPLDSDGPKESKRGPSPASSSLEFANAEWSTFVPVVAPSKTLCCRTPPRSQEALTVEAFLRRSSGQKYTGKRRADRKKKRLRTKILPVHESVNLGGRCNAEEDEDEENAVKLRSRKFKRAIISSDSSSSEKELEMETSPISFGPSSPLPGPKNNRRKAKKSLKERIYEAAISTYGDPDPGFVLPETEGDPDDSKRLPLRFVPGPGTTPSKKTRIVKKKNWCLVDPRKSMAIRTATFSSRIRPPHLAFNAEPLQEGTVNDAKWTSLGAPSIKLVDRRLLEKKVSNETKPTKTSSVLAPRTITCPPLTFVSMHEAEDSYAALLSGKGTQVHQKAKIDSASTLPMAPLDEKFSRPIPLEDNPILINQPTPLKRHLAASGAAQPKAQPKAQQVSLDKDISVQAVDLQPSLDSLEISILSPIRSSTSSPSAPMADKSNTIVSIILPPQQKSDQQKTLKPLDSFLDEILATIRKVTRTESTRQPCPITDTPRNDGRPESFERRSLRHGMFGRKQDIDGSESGSSGSASMCTSLNPGFDDQDFETNVSSRRSLSPDILAVLQPSDYQVILSPGIP